MPDSQKLTKKGKKALLHRDKQSRSEKRKSKLDALQDLPLAEDEAVAEPEASTSAPKKRKLDPSSDAPPSPKKAKQAPAEKPAKPQRWICFCGNLPYDVTQEQLATHFTTDDGIAPTIRLQATKATKEAAAQPKGFAFLEYPSSHSMQHALQLHHSLLGKRKINVELTAGGGGNSAARQAKIKAQKAKLGAQREKRVKKLKEDKDKKRAAYAAATVEASKGGEDGPAPPKKATKDRKAKQPWLTGPNAVRLG